MNIVRRQAINGSYSPSVRVIELERENRKLRRRIEEQDKEIAILKQMIQDMQMQLSQLQEMIFKKKRKKNEETDEDGDIHDGSSSMTGKENRSKESYRRAIPDESEVTAVEEYSLHQCGSCGSVNVEELDTRVMYIEDIPEVIKSVLKKIIHVYRCIECGKEQSATAVPRGQMVILGSRVKSQVLYLSLILHMSFRDIERYVWNMYQLTVSAGEIAYIQKESAKQLLPFYNGIKERLNEQESTNVDETGWQSGKEKQYVWGRSSPTIPDVLIHIGNRGRGNADIILNGFSGCVVSDCYGAYKNLHTRLNGIEHQICWVHILREAKEIAYSPHLTHEQRTSAQAFLIHLQGIYHDVKLILTEAFDQERRVQQIRQFAQRLQQINELLPCDTPKKLRNLKLRTQEYVQELFTCLKYQTALPENNLAERNLRHLVLKRKRSFGSASQQGARIFAINFSVVYTLWKTHHNSFFPELQRALCY